ncbi:excalibur calcium-binding domain-containing protein [Pseudooceanicola sp.]|uniref:excalibur calcium-binding domain-containing protein n=1 Tax=Pseudooceanicola sp. TaxID=1914328 RepID=UPI00261CCE2B|nr:excalibur calcium-binding domain-containing protein [Pseudooceanicola sp.]MDF1853896.1 excalibur calcium-binding domain-containing protein [Pseudooceanicola sp.]
MKKDIYPLQRRDTWRPQGARMASRARSALLAFVAAAALAWIADRCVAELNRPFPVSIKRANQGPDLDCADFVTRWQATRFLRALGGDRHRLDDDRDGVACERLPWITLR